MRRLASAQVWLTDPLQRLGRPSIPPLQRRSYPAAIDAQVWVAECTEAGTAPFGPSAEFDLPSDADIRTADGIHIKNRFDR